MKRIKQWLRVRLAYALEILPFSTPSTKFVIFGQGRTGSTLLVDLLNSADDIHCDKEIFNIFHFTGEKIRNPLQYIKGRSKRFSSKVYGFKVKIYQLRYDHGIHDVKDLLIKLSHQGFKIIYISRENVLQHAYSNVKRSLTGVTHVRGQNKSKAKLTLPVQDLLDEIALRQQFKREELEVLNGLSYYHIIYENHLLQSPEHLQTINGVRNYLGIAPLQKVESKYRKITDNTLSNEITNYDEVRRALQEKKLDHLIW